LREHRTERRRAVCRVTSRGEAEFLTKEHEKRGTLLGGGLGEELGDLKDCLAEHARLVREGGAIVHPFDLRYRGLQESLVGDARWERVRILRIILYRNGENGKRKLTERRMT